MMGRPSFGGAALFIGVAVGGDGGESIGGEVCADS